MTIMAARLTNAIKCRLGVAAVISLAHCALPAAAVAETADKEKPVNVESDHATVTQEQAQQVTVFEGNVNVVQGTMRMQADRILVRKDADGLLGGTAFGAPVRFRQKREGADDYVEAYAERIEYNARNDVIELFTQAHLVRGKDDVRGNYIFYNTATEYFKVLGGPQSANGNNPQGRVRITIQPKVPPAPAQPPALLKPSGEIANPRVP